MTTETRIAHLTLKYLQDALNDAERAELKAWLEESDGHQALFDHYSDLAVLGDTWQKDAALMQRVQKTLFPGAALKPEVHNVHFLKTAWFRYAAVVLLIAGTATYLFQISRPAQDKSQQQHGATVPDIPPGGNKAILTLADGSTIVLDSANRGLLANQGTTEIIKLADGTLTYKAATSSNDVGYNVVTTPKGGQYQILLPDGSKVWLNAASSVRFPTAFSGNSRNVEVRGEVYMEIAKNPDRSFVVTANGTQIQVLGTSFNLNAYADEHAVKTTLIEGSVKVVKTKAVILKPGQQCSVMDDQLQVMNNTDIEQTLAWKNGRFQFNHTGLDEIMRQLARWYDIEVIYSNGVPDLKFDGDMKRDLTLSQMLDFLKEFGVKLRTEGRRVVIL